MWRLRRGTGGGDGRDQEGTPSVWDTPGGKHGRQGGGYIDMLFRGVVLFVDYPVRSLLCLEEEEEEEQKQEQEQEESKKNTKGKCCYETAVFETTAMLCCSW